MPRFKAKAVKQRTRYSRLARKLSCGCALRTRKIRMASHAIFLQDFLFEYDLQTAPQEGRTTSSLRRREL